MRKIAGILAYLFAVNAVLSATPSVAVVDFEGINCSEEYGRGVAELLSTTLFETGAFRMIERSQINRVMEEQAFQFSGAVDPSTVAEFGRILGADYVGVGSITKFGSTYTVSIRFVDVETAEISLANSSTAEGEGEIPGICREVANQMADKTSVIHLRLRAEDSAVEVYVDGHYTGVCPVEVDVSKGTHQIRFRYTGTYGYDETVTVRYASVDVGKTETINCPNSSLPQLRADAASKAVQEDPGFQIARALLILALLAGALLLFL